jgi:hypothetical protein
LEARVALIAEKLGASLMPQRLRALHEVGGVERSAVLAHLQHRSRVGPLNALLRKASPQFGRVIHNSEKNGRVTSSSI